VIVASRRTTRPALRTVPSADVGGDRPEDPEQRRRPLQRQVVAPKGHRRHRIEDRQREPQIGLGHLAARRASSLPEPDGRGDRDPTGPFSSCSSARFGTFRHMTLRPATRDTAWATANFQQGRLMT
jgi:hypothetical protein